MRPTRNIRLILAYDGANYAGFQRQADAPTIQAVLEEALGRLTGQAPRLTGAGRTDAGVHALGQVVSFRTSSALDVARFVPALNSLLPRDVAVLDAAEVPAAFDARRSAVSKTYTYRIWRAAVRPVFERGRVYHFPRPLDVEAMRQAAGLFVGRHDFAAFRSAGSGTRTSVRTILDATWEEAGEVLAFSVTADGFLYRMVRNMVGTMLQVGLCRRPPAWVGELLQAKDRRLAGPSVPAEGLFLVKVEYGEEDPDENLTAP